MPVKQEQIFVGYPSTNEPVTLRVIGTAEGLTFCALSVQAGAFITRPGEFLVIQLMPTVQAIQYQQYQNLQNQYAVGYGAPQSHGVTHQPHGVTHQIVNWTVTVLKETEIPEAPPDV